MGSLIKIIYSSLGLATVYGFVNYILKAKNLKMKPELIKLGGYTFGVYLFQQFVLKFMYISPFFVSNINQWWTPWLAFVLALSVSLLCSWLLNKTKVGRFLIG